jgi:hypothetical protein
MNRFAMRPIPPMTALRRRSPVVRDELAADMLGPLLDGGPNRVKPIITRADSAAASAGQPYGP